MAYVRATKKARSSRIGLKPLASPVADSYWILCNPTNLFDEKKYRVVVVTGTERKYGRAGHQQAFVVVVSANSHLYETNPLTYTLPYDDFEFFFRKLEGEELADEMALILLANA